MKQESEHSPKVTAQGRGTEAKASECDISLTQSMMHFRIEASLLRKDRERSSLEADLNVQSGEIKVATPRGATAARPRLADGPESETKPPPFRCKPRLSQVEVSAGKLSLASTAALGAKLGR